MRPYREAIGRPPQTSGHDMKYKTVAAALLSLAAGIAIGLAADTNSYAEKSLKDPYARLDTFAQVLSVVEGNYVDDIDRTAMIDGAIQGMIRALDPHSGFMTAQARKAFEQMTSGAFVGIGMEVGIRDNELRIIMTFYGGPAQKAGLQSGDVILGIDGKDISKMSLDQITQALRGAPGTAVRLTIRHPGNLGTQNYTVKRAVVQLDTVRSRMLDDDYAYVAVRSFGEGTTKKVRAEIDNLNSLTQHGLKGIILDLRKNPGGFLLEGFQLANLFIPSGNIVSTRGRNGVLIQSYDATRDRYAYDLPLAVLIDESSASASEIVAGALQDHHRAIIVGQTSFGKATVQNLFPLSDGSSVKLTIGRYYTPSGRCIQGQGIVPDVEVEDLQLQVKKRTIIREKDLPNTLSAKTAGGKAPDPAAKDTNPAAKDAGNAAPAAKDDAPSNTTQPANAEIAEISPEPLPSIDDLQLFTALQQLRAREFFLGNTK